MAKKVTIKDIADMAGVSIATVSHVINRTRYVSPDLVEKIENIIIETGYHKKIEEKERRLKVGRQSEIVAVIPNVEIDVKIIVDHDMIEAFIDEQIAFTYRIYAKPEFETGIIAQDSNVEFYNLSISGK